VDDWNQTCVSTFPDAGVTQTNLFTVEESDILTEKGNELIVVSGILNCLGVSLYHCAGSAQANFS